MDVCLFVKIDDIKVPIISESRIIDNDYYL